MKRRTKNEAFKAALERLEQKPGEFAHLIGVTTRAVQLWCSGDRPIPEPVILITRLLLRGRVTVGELYTMRPVVLRDKKRMTSSKRGNIWDQLYSNAKRIVKE